MIIIYTISINIFIITLIFNISNSFLYFYLNLRWYEMKPPALMSAGGACRDDADTELFIERADGFDRHPVKRNDLPALPYGLPVQKCSMDHRLACMAANDRTKFDKGAIMQHAAAVAATRRQEWQSENVLRLVPDQLVAIAKQLILSLADQYGIAMDDSFLLLAG